MQEQSFAMLMLCWKASPSAPHNRSQHITGVHPHLNHPLNCHLPQPPVLWWQRALVTRGSAAAKLLTSRQHWCPEPWQCVACSHCRGKIMHPYREWVKEQFVFSLVIVGVCRGLGRASPRTRDTWTRPDPWQLFYLFFTYWNHVLEFMIPFYKPEISSSTNRNI